VLCVNPKKTEVVIFQKKCRKSLLGKHLFQINNDKIEIVNNYTYLGINFSANGNFRDCKSTLKDKTRRSIFATRRYLDFSKLSLSVSNRLFDSLFLPILLYGSEVWGIYDKDDFNNWEKDDIEKTRIYCCKQFLGVNKQCPNVAATRNEFGRLPLKLAIETSIIKFWIHLQSLPENNIAKQCLQLSNEMADNNQTGLMHKIRQLCKTHSSSITLNENNRKLFASHIKQNLSKALTAHQLKLISTNRRLHFYHSFKTYTKKSGLLDAINNPHHTTTQFQTTIKNKKKRLNVD